jgi:hypothetical protein
MDRSGFRIKIFPGEIVGIHDYTVLSTAAGIGARRHQSSAQVLQNGAQLLQPVAALTIALPAFRRGTGPPRLFRWLPHQPGPELSLSGCDLRSAASGSPLAIRVDRRRYHDTIFHNLYDRLGSPVPERLTSPEMSTCGWFTVTAAVAVTVTATA